MAERCRALEILEMTAPFWHGRTVFMTGHTGFKGAWLTLWLQYLGAAVYGYALDPTDEPNLFQAAGIEQLLAGETRADIRDGQRLFEAMRAAQPQVVWHLAAQPLVRVSYKEPIETFAVNVLGTAHVLEAARRVTSVQAVVIVTTDKCYDPKHAFYPYRETDRLGGHDPYSASKACAEIVTASYRTSFLGADPAAGRADGVRHVGIASARAGNVIGAGDWARDRLVPDCVRAFGTGNAVTLRYPDAVRPWQHVLDPLAGYLLLAEKLLSADRGCYERAWNFGPHQDSEATVAEVAHRLCRLWGSGRVDRVSEADEPNEAEVLRLDTTQARMHLGWQPRWSLSESLRATVEGYRAWYAGEDIAACVRQQVKRYMGAQV